MADLPHRPSREAISARTRLYRGNLLSAPQTVQRCTSTRPAPPARSSSVGVPAAADCVADPHCAHLIGSTQRKNSCLNHRAAASASASSRPKGVNGGSLAEESESAGLSVVVPVPANSASASARTGATAARANARSSASLPSARLAQPIPRIRLTMPPNPTQCCLSAPACAATPVRRADARAAARCACAGVTRTPAKTCASAPSSAVSVGVGARRPGIVVLSLDSRRRATYPATRSGGRYSDMVWCGVGIDARHRFHAALVEVGATWSMWRRVGRVSHFRLFSAVLRLHRT
jgi:hypothetical protein